MRQMTWTVMTVWLLAVIAAGCGTHRMAPVNPKVVGTLKAETQDSDANLVGAAPGFSLKEYSVLYVEAFVVDPSQMKDDEDARLVKDMAAYLHAQLIKRLQGANLGMRVVDGTTAPAPPASEKVLRLQGEIPRLTDGEQALRYFVGFGAGAAKAQMETRFVDAETGQTRLITVDRRAAGLGIFGGDGRQFLTEAMNEMADGLAKLLKRLSAGGKLGAS